MEDDPEYRRAVIEEGYDPDDPQVRRAIADTVAVLRQVARLEHSDFGSIAGVDAAVTSGGLGGGGQ